MSSDQISPPVTVLIDHMAIGGGTTVAASLVELWLGWGVDAEVVALGPVTPEARSLFGVGVLTELGAVRHSLKVLRLRRHLLASASPDRVIMSLGDYPALVAALAGLASRSSGRPRLIVAEHQPHALEDLLGGRRWPLGSIARAAIARLRAATTASICLSEAQRADIVAAGRSTPEKSVVIPNPCVMDVAPGRVVADRVRRLSSGAKVRLLAVGSLNAAKNHRMLLRSLSRLDPRFTLTIAGAGDREALIRTGRDVGVTGRFELLGPRPDVAELMDEHDLFVLSSDYESFGLVVVEAIARGLPVIATACNSSLPRLAETYQGLALCRVGDDEAFATAVLAQADFRWSADALRRDAATAVGAHSPKRSAEQHLDLFRRIVGGLPVRG